MAGRPANYRVSWGIFAAGATRADAPTTFKPGGYSVFDAYLNWKPTSYITVRGGVQNIFDRRYFADVLNYAKTATAATAATNPLELQTAPGRTFKLAASVEF